MSRIPELQRDYGRRPLLTMLTRSGNLLVLLAIVSVVLVFHPNAYNAYMDPKNGVLRIQGLFLLALTLSCTFGIRISRAQIHFLLVLVFFLAANVLSLVGAVNLQESLLQLVVLISFVAAAAWVHRAFRRSCSTDASLHALKKFLTLLGFATLLVSLYGLLQVAGYDFVSTEVPRWPVSTIGNLNFAAQFLIAAIPLLLAAMLISRTGLARLYFFFSISLATIHLLLTKSRGGMVGFVVGMGAFLIVSLLCREVSMRESFAAHRKKILITGAGIFIILATFVFLDNGDILSQARSVFASGKDTNRYRLLTWRDTLRMVSDRPILGVGVGNFRFVFPKYRSEELLAEQNIFSTIRQIRTHNDYLNILGETGILGFSAFVAFLIFVARRTVAYLIRARRTRPADALYVVIGLASAIVATLTQSLFDFNLYNPASGLLFWLCAGLLAGHTANHEAPARENTMRANAPRYGIILLFAFLAAMPFASAWILKPYVASFFNKAGLELLKAKDYATAVNVVTRGQRADPQNIEAAALLADGYRNRGNLREAAAAYQKWSALEINYLPALNGLGYCLARLGEYKGGEAAFRRALDINPLNAAALNNLANLYLLQGEYARALPYFERAARRDDRITRENRPNYAQALFQLKRYGEALAIYEQLYNESPGNLRIAERLAECYRRTGKNQEAEALSTRLRILGIARE